MKHIARDSVLRRKTGWMAALCVVVLVAGAAWHLMAADYVSQPAGKRLLLLIGSNTLGEAAVPALAQAYLKSQKGANEVAVQRSTDVIYVTGMLPDGHAVYIEIHPTGSGDCFQSFLGNYPAADKTCDIGMSSRRISQSEADAIKDKLGSDFFTQANEPGQGCEHAVAMDGVAIVVQKDVPISRISFSELRAIYSRKITDWNQTADWKENEASGPGIPVVPYRRKEPSGTLDIFKERINPDPAPMSDESVIPAFVSSRDLVAKVAATPGGIGFVGQGFSTQAGLKRLQVYNDLPPEFMKAEEASFPDAIAVQQEYYPLARVVYFYTPILNVNPEVDPFIEYTLSEEGQAVIASTGSLIKIEGTVHAIAVEPRITPQAASAAPSAIADGRQKKIILRLEGSNTVGAECAVNLAYDYLMSKRENASARIEDQTTELETPEGEKAKAHDVMCDLHGDGIWETIQIRPTGSSDAFRGLQNGDCDIGMSSRPISENEKRDLLPVCGNLTQPSAQFALGLDALAVIVSNANQVEQITVEQVRSVFLGQTKDWSELGGGKLPIQLHTRPGSLRHLQVLLRFCPHGGAGGELGKAPCGELAGGRCGIRGPGRNRLCANVRHGHGENAPGGTGGGAELFQADGGNRARRDLSSGTLPLCLFLRASGATHQFQRGGAGELGNGAAIRRSEPDLAGTGDCGKQRIHNRYRHAGPGRPGAPRRGRERPAVSATLERAGKESSAPAGASLSEALQWHDMSAAAV